MTTSKIKMWTTDLVTCVMRENQIQGSRSLNLSIGYNKNCQSRPKAYRASYQGCRPAPQMPKRQNSTGFILSSAFLWLHCFLRTGNLWKQLWKSAKWCDLEESGDSTFSPIATTTSMETRLVQEKPRTKTTSECLYKVVSRRCKLRSSYQATLWAFWWANCMHGEPKLQNAFDAFSENRNCMNQFSTKFSIKARVLLGYWSFGTR